MQRVDVPEVTGLDEDANLFLRFTNRGVEDRLARIELA
ncbi:hypothetical protein C8D88_1011546 [Lentzea atacamensis]|uniref:Uncharacterized protein n=1 Tax=Lentzea atacamensis TaxID=531938 RepID=A0A316IM45_9PSEU|nr:hypothetical protein C8D88_1011546 [Lentzea atacamensis]